MSSGLDGIVCWDGEIGSNVWMNLVGLWFSWSNIMISPPHRAYNFYRIFVFFNSGRGKYIYSSFNVESFQFLKLKIRSITVKQCQHLERRSCIVIGQA